jgi:hypothetical protein
MPISWVIQQIVHYLMKRLQVSGSKIYVVTVVVANCKKTVQAKEELRTTALLFGIFNYIDLSCVA